MTLTRTMRTRDRLRLVKAQTSLAEVVHQYGVALDGAKTSRVRQAPCPFHEEVKPSFTVYGDSQRYYCFGCGAKGDAFDFLQAVGAATDLHQAIRQLAGGNVEGERPKTFTKKTAGRRREYKRDGPMLRSAMRHYAELLLAPDRNAGARYLRSRGITRKTAQRLSLGYAPGGTLRDRLLAQGRYDPGRVAQSGLFVDGKERFAGMVVVPEMIGDGVGWLTGRAVAPTAQPRFQALPGPKPPLLGGGRLDTSRKWVVLTEGVFDWLTLVQWGYPAVALQGATGLERVVAELEGVSRVFLALDADAAGREAADRVRELLADKEVIDAGLPAGAGDVADLATLADGRKLFTRGLVGAAERQAVNAYEGGKPIR